MRPIRLTLISAPLLLGLVAALIIFRQRPVAESAAGSANAPTLATPPETARAKVGISAKADQPRLPRWLAPDVVRSAALPSDDAASKAAELERQAARAVESAKTTRTLADGTVARLVAKRPRFAAGRPVELELELSDKDGAPLPSRADIELITWGEDADNPTKAGFVENPSAPGHYAASLDVSARGPGNLYATAVVPLQNQDPETAKSTMLRIQVEQGAEAALVGEPSLDSSQDFAVRFQVDSKVAGAAVIKAELCDAAGQVLMIGEASAELTVGPNVVSLPFAQFDPAATGATRDNLWVNNVVLFAGSPLRWTDFWTIPKRIAPAAEQP